MFDFYSEEEKNDKVSNSPELHKAEKLSRSYSKIRKIVFFNWLQNTF